MFLICERRNLISLIGCFLATGTCGKEANPTGLRKSPSIREETTTRRRQYSPENNKRILQALDVNTADAAELVSFLVAAESGITTSNIKFIGNSNCKAIFRDAQSVVSGLTPPFPDTGVILSTGTASEATGPNDSIMTSTDFKFPGDANLDSLKLGKTEDACVLEFDFQCAGEGWDREATFDYVFASEEYEEFSNSEFNDVLGIFLNGNNIATLPGTSTPISVSNVNEIVNSEFYVGNKEGDYNIEFDGFTTTLQAKGSVSAGINSMKIAVADVSDGTFDSYILMKGSSFQCAAPCDCEAGLGQQCCINENSKNYKECVYASDLSIYPITRPLAGGTKCCAHPTDPTRIIMQHPNFGCP